MKQYYKLILLFLCISSVILLKSYFDQDGCISPDSAFYLRLSQNLVHGEGFRIPDYTSPDGKSFFAIWPVGYPVLIFLVSKVSGLGVAWASKWLTLLILAVILLIFHYIFKENAHWAGLIFFVDSFILIFSYTWSEVPFILFLLCSCMALYKSVETKGSFLWLVVLFFSGIALFLMRYIGLFYVGVIGIIALVVFIRREWLLSVKLMATGALQVIFAAAYLYHNKITTGYTTGMPRHLPQESNHELFNQLLAALKEEFIVINCGIPLTVSFIMVFIVAAYLYLTRGKKTEKKHSDLWKFFLLTGVVYYFCMTVTKWFSDFSALDYRYMFPGTFFIILSIAVYLNGRPKVKIMQSTLIYLAVLLTLTIHYVPHARIKYIKGYFKNPNYIENTRAVLDRYKEVEPGSVVVFGSIHLRYLMDDIIPTDIYSKSSLEDMNNYFTQKKDWNVYINITNDLKPEQYHESFIKFMEANKDKQLVKVHERVK